MLTSKLNRRLDPYIYKFVRFFTKRSINPNLITLIGCGINLLAGILLAIGSWIVGGILILVAGAFDIMDGAIARGDERTSLFGGFIDSVMDRYSDLFLMFGILVFYASKDSLPMVVLTSLVIIGTILVPYSRAKAETFIEKCDVGITERPERILLLAVGALFGWMKVILWFLVIFTNITVIQRIYFVWRQSSIQKVGRNEGTDSSSGGNLKI
jgi:CDP-diacylglycerol--glycerol-3-phosphate 3-phosphatidyltransferase